MNGVGEREKTCETSLDRAKSSRERERKRESDRTVGAAESDRVWQSLAILYFLPELLYPKLVHF